MKIRVTLMLIIMVFGIVTTYSQIQSPIGKWVLTEHIVFDKYDSINGYWIEKNVFNNEFEAFMVFDSCGGYYQQISDSAIYGQWKLSKSDRKLKVKFSNGGSFSQVKKTRFNFNNPLYLSEHFAQYYDNIEYNTWGGESKYVRVHSNDEIIDTNLLLGKWKITHRQIGKNKKKYNGSWFFEYKKDTISERIKYIGKWSVFGEELTDEIVAREKWDPYRIKYDIEQVKNNTFVFIGIDSRKLELIYLERIK